MTTRFAGRGMQVSWRGNDTKEALYTWYVDILLVARSLISGKRCVTRRAWHEIPSKGIHRASAVNPAANYRHGHLSTRQSPAFSRRLVRPRLPDGVAGGVSR